MRTSIDIPDALYDRVRRHVAARGLTVRALVVDSLERSLNADPPTFRLRDAAAGYQAEAGRGVTAAAINAAIDELRQPPGRP